ncbi:MAG: Rne/Rng family ribonuclease, partial [Pseudomonadota bacterium]
MKRMLFNATQEEELRVAMVDGQRLYDLNIELPASERKKANIYKGTITRIEPSLEAAFVNYGAERHGFLPLKEISDEYFVKPNTGGGKPNIKEVLREGQDIVIQIDKEERGNKGAALTTYVSLAGRFIVLKPNKSRSGGVSRRIVGEDRDLARRSLKEIDVPDGMSVILRTAGIDRSAEELGWDLNNLMAIWEAIKSVVLQRPSPFLIYRESDSVVRALRDYLTNEVGEILIDDEKAHEDAREFIEQVMPHNLRKLKHYVDPVPLFTRYQIESQIESAFAHLVTLPSGGSMVIDHTEALVSIDINSARATKGGDIEATALQTNLEAADEIGRQLRLRDLGGLIVIDFIDMGPQKHQREVESRLREAVRQDRARVQIGKISRFGLLEMSRQRLRPSLGESSYLTCPRCSGVGTIRSVESLALAILRIIGEEARKERTAKVIAQLPVEVATYLLNEKRDWVQNVESRHEMQVILVANPALETPHYVVRRVRDDQTDLPENAGTSYTLTEAEQEQVIPEAIQPKAPAELPAVSSQVKTTPAPKPRAKAAPEEASADKGGILTRIMGLFTPAADAEAESADASRRDSGDSRSRGGQRNRRRADGQKSDSKRQTRGKKKTTAKRGKKSATSEEKQTKRG